MKEFKKITKIKFFLFIIYWLTFFTPIYSQMLYGFKLKVSISELGGGTFFIVFFSTLFIATGVTKFLYEKYHDYVYFGTVGFMGLFAILLLVFRDPGSVLRITYYFQLIITILLIFAMLSEEIVILTFDKAVYYIKKWTLMLVKYLKRKFKEIKDTKTENENAKEEAK